MASQMVGQSEPARDCLPQAGPDAPMVVEHLGTVQHELCRELLLEMGDGRRRSGDTYRLFVAEHFPVFSVGTHHQVDAELRASLPAQLIRTGGIQSLSFHGPGQVSIYGCVLVNEPLDVSDVLNAVREGWCDWTGRKNILMTTPKNRLISGTQPPYGRIRYGPVTDGSLGPACYPLPRLQCPTEPILAGVQ